VVQHQSLQQEADIRSSADKALSERRHVEFRRSLMRSRSRLPVFRELPRSSAHSPLCTLESKADRLPKVPFVEPVAKEVSNGIRGTFRTTSRLTTAATHSVCVHFWEEVNESSFT